MLNAEYMSHWSKNRRMVAEVKDEEAQRMQERFELELVLSANKSPVRGALPLGEADS